MPDEVRIGSISLLPAAVKPGRCSAHTSTAWGCSTVQLMMDPPVMALLTPERASCGRALSISSRHSSVCTMSENV
jgi:hypothetical protein